MNRLLNNALKITASAAETILCLSLSFPATQKQTHIGNTTTTTTTTQIPPSPAPSPLCCAASIIQILSCLFQTAGSSLPPPPSPSLSLSLCLSFSLSRKRKVWGEKELFEGQSWQNHTQTKYTKLHWTANVEKNVQCIWILAGTLSIVSSLLLHLSHSLVQFSYLPHPWFQ